MITLSNLDFRQELISYYKTLDALNKCKYVFAVNPDSTALSYSQEVVAAVGKRPIWIEVYARPIKNQDRVDYSAVSETVSTLRSEYANFNNVFIGVGTQDDPRGLQKSIKAGAQFAVAHVYNPEVLKTCAINFIPCVLGCQTVSEITNCVNQYRKDYPFFVTSEELKSIGIDPSITSVDEVWVKLFPAKECRESYFQYVNTLFGRGIKVLVAGGVDLGPKTNELSSMNICDVLNWPLVNAVTLSRMSKGSDGKSDPKPGDIKNNVEKLYELVEQS